MKKLIHISLLLIIFTPGIIAQDCYPLVDIQYGFLLGNDDCDYSTHAFALTGGETYKLYTLTEYLGTGVGEEPETYEGPCEEQLYVRIAYAETETPPVMGIRADYDPFPKTLKVQSVESETYKKITKEVLENEGLSNPNVKIKSLVRTDLEGDGVEEVVVCASYFKVDDGYAASVGDYSILFCRKIVEGNVKNIVLSRNIYAEVDEYGMQYYIDLAAILDVNGDGKMEIIMNEGYYEGHGTIVFEIENDDFNILMMAGCGA